MLMINRLIHRQFSSAITYMFYWTIC